MDGKCRDRLRTPLNIKMVFNGINPANNFAKFSAPGVWESPEVLGEMFNVMVIDRKTQDH